HPGGKARTRLAGVGAGVVVGDDIAGEGIDLQHEGLALARVVAGLVHHELVDRAGVVFIDEVDRLVVGAELDAFVGNVGDAVQFANLDVGRLRHRVQHFDHAALASPFLGDDDSIVGRPYRRVERAEIPAPVAAGAA